MKSEKIVTAIVIVLGILTFGLFGRIIYNYATTEWTYKEEAVIGKIIRMEYEEGEWERKKKTKKVKASDGSEKTETYYTTEWDEPEYEIDFEYYNKEGKDTQRYYYEKEESSELYDYLKDNKLMRGAEVELLIEKTYANDKYYSQRVKDVRIKGDKFRSFLWN